MVNDEICFPDAKQLNKCLKLTVWRLCTYVKNERSRINGIIYFPPDSEHNFSTIYFHEKNLLDVSTIETYKRNELAKGTKIGYELSSQQYEQEMKVPYKKKDIYWKTRYYWSVWWRERQQPPRVHPRAWWRNMKIL